MISFKFIFIFLCIYRIHPSRLDGRQVSPVKILDYKMLAVEEYVNDILIEYYLR